MYALMSRMFPDRVEMIDRLRGLDDRQWAEAIEKAEAMKAAGHVFTGPIMPARLKVTIPADWYEVAGEVIRDEMQLTGFGAVGYDGLFLTFEWFPYTEDEQLKNLCGDFILALIDGVIS